MVTKRWPPLKQQATPRAPATTTTTTTSTPTTPTMLPLPVPTLPAPIDAAKYGAGTSTRGLLSLRPAAQPSPGLSGTPPTTPSPLSPLVGMGPGAGVKTLEGGPLSPPPGVPLPFAPLQSPRGRFRHFAAKFGAGTSTRGLLPLAQTSAPALPLSLTAPSLLVWLLMALLPLAAALIPPFQLIAGPLLLLRRASNAETPIWRTLPPLRTPATPRPMSPRPCGSSEPPP